MKSIKKKNNSQTSPRLEESISSGCHDSLLLGNSSDIELKLTGALHMKYLKGWRAQLDAAGRALTLAGIARSLNQPQSS